MLKFPGIWRAWCRIGAHLLSQIIPSGCVVIILNTCGQDLHTAVIKVRDAMAYSTLPTLQNSKKKSKFGAGIDYCGSGPPKWVEGLAAKVLISCSKKSNLPKDS